MSDVYDFYNEQLKKQSQEREDKANASALAKTYSVFDQDSVDSEYERQMRLRVYKKEFFNTSGTVPNDVADMILRNAPKSLKNKDVTDYLSNQGIWMNWKKK